MKIYIDLLVVAAITIYIVDVSGFTESWKSALRRRLPRLKQSIPPFDCGKCMTWWTCLIFTICTGHLGLLTVAYCALLSLLSIPIGSAMIFIREWLNKLISFLMPR